jgi:hypothetical protein
MSNIISYFTSNQNLIMLWDVLLDELRISKTNKPLLSNIKMVFDSNIKPFTNRINVKANPNLMELNKQFLSQVVLAVNKLFPKGQNNIQRITITNEEVSEPYKIEDIHASRQSEFEKEVSRKKSELENYMTPQKPRELDFSDKMLDGKIIAMDCLVAEKMAERNQEMELLQNTSYNTGGIDRDKWLSPVETSVKGEKVELRVNELTNTNGNKKLKHIAIDDENNIVFQKEKKVSWSNDDLTSSLFQKLKRKPEEPSTQILEPPDLLVTKELDYEEQRSSSLPEVKQEVIYRNPTNKQMASNVPIVPKSELATQINEMNAKIDMLYEMVVKLTKMMEVGEADLKPSLEK